MNEQDNRRIHELCSKIAMEQDHKKFLALVEELNRILSAQDRRFQNKLPDENKND
jgi:hypothetical protein